MQTRHQIFEISVYLASAPISKTKVGQELNIEQILIARVVMANVMYSVIALLYWDIHLGP